MLTLGASRCGRGSLAEWYGPDRRGRQVDDPLADAAARIASLAAVGAGRGRIEDDVDVLEFGKRNQPVDALGGCRDAEARGPR